jgi:hypothetical protein
MTYIPIYNDLFNGFIAKTERIGISHFASIKRSGFAAGLIYSKNQPECNAVDFFMRVKAFFERERGNIRGCYFLIFYARKSVFLNAE